MTAVAVYSDVPAKDVAFGVIVCGAERGWSVWPGRVEGPLGHDTASFVWPGGSDSPAAFTRASSNCCHQRWEASCSMVRGLCSRGGGRPWCRGGLGRLSRWSRFRNKAAGDNVEEEAAAGRTNKAHPSGDRRQRVERRRSSFQLERERKRETTETRRMDAATTFPQQHARRARLRHCRHDYPSRPRLLIPNNTPLAF